ncbi:carnitine palmitoyltransferase I, putative [Pediculus humanus corporis]|uniref:carnitine O-palmitoyltransferase n=1 Tax=Pediculus humanus subsp. corporis TaxID=121224 RepID=E0V9V5_PEDHC|nr:carnitine palmitoyltransferase I, putative [Pediculus humanus corporis]EEB10161.1 carnitine palmitoyltransferase I, putative [Pediculus humanus corporis]
MAEAHSAVAFSFAITHEGWDVNFDREVLNLVWASGIRSWKKRIARFKNSIKNGVYPASMQSFWITASILAGLHFIGIRAPNGLLVRILPLLPDNTFQWQLIGCCVVALFWWMTCIYFIRYTLKFALMYKGWMYEERGKDRKISMKTKIWLLLVKLLMISGRPQLYSFQGSLPRLPLPSINDTMKRYLRSVRPLLDDVEYEKMEKLAAEFENGIGRKLQRYLSLKSWWSTNYVSDWWEEYVYLRGRAPLMVNSNFYGIDAIFRHLTSRQASRAAVIIHALLQFRRLIDRQELAPILVQGLVPLCSWQYERAFNTTRVPGKESDKIVHYSDSNHIVVYHKGRYFKVLIYYKNRLLNPVEIEMQMEQILNDDSPSIEEEEKIAVLTAGNRSKWGQTRQDFFFKGPNRVALDTIEKSAFFVCLDDVPYVINHEQPNGMDEYGRILLHGKGYDKWFDKSFTLFFYRFQIGFNAEHSWADAPVMGHAWEHILQFESLSERYTDDGHCVGTAEFTPPPPTRITWQISKDLKAAIDSSYEKLSNVFRHIMFKDYGKGFMKKCKVSPDAYIQMALQLAYYRDFGKFSLTYEASMTRLYREGRTETVRSCTVESADWVKSMHSSKIPASEKIGLLRKACALHQKGYQDAMCGKGIDRHLFCLYVVSKYLEVDSPFLHKVLSEPWRLSTSQTPHGQTANFDLKKYPTCISAGGGFGPVADDGYGVSYIIAGEDLIFFHISSKVSSSYTNSNRFANQVEKALLDMKKLFEDYEKNQINGDM